MLPGRRPLPGLLLLLFLAPLVGCSAEEAPAAFARADVAVPSYAAPADAPAFCADLADSTGLTQVPGAIGVLTVAPGDVEAKLDLSAAVGELRGVLGDVQSAGGHAELEAQLGNLVAALQEATGGTVTDSIRAAVVGGLDDIGTQVQPLCEFPE